jgi:hypothetical protein
VKQKRKPVRSWERRGLFGMPYRRNWIHVSELGLIKAFPNPSVHTLSSLSMAKGSSLSSVSCSYKSLGVFVRILLKFCQIAQFPLVSSPFSTELKCPLLRCLPQSYYLKTLSCLPGHIELHDGSVFSQL